MNKFEIGDFVEVYDASHSYCGTYGTIREIKNDGSIEIQEFDCGVNFVANENQIQYKL